MNATALKQTAGQSQYLTFQIAGEEYAIGVLRVREIIEYETVTKVPMTPPSIRGVINLRGSVVPVVDLAVKFGIPPTAVTNRTCIVVVEVELDDERTVMGVMSDAVSKVIEFRPEDIEKPPAFGTRVRVDYLMGMGKLGQKFALILDIDRVLSTNELLAAAMLQAAPADAEGPSVDAGEEGASPPEAETPEAAEVSAADVSVAPPRSHRRGRKNASQGSDQERDEPGEVP